MKKSSVFAALALAAASLSAQTFPTTSVLPALLADGTAGCVTGAALVLTIPVTGVVGATGVTLDFSFDSVDTHSWHGDLDCIVTAPSGASSQVMVPGCLGSLDDSSDVQGPYVLMDGAAMTFDAAALAAGLLIPAGTYAPDNALNPLLSCGTANGTWTVTFLDHFIGDAGTVAACALTFGVGAPTSAFTVCQTGPGALVNLIHSAGSAAITWTNVVTIANPAAVPLGWWFGLDAPMFGPLGVIDQLTNYPGLFFGTLPPGGTNTLPVPLPPGFNFQTVGVHFDAAGIPVFAGSPIDYTVL